ncbi:Fungalysin/Thermolysin Extracellular metalloproteinase 5 [Coelomomyces lativittatus]|nr:Fungalysin/Thermolysin Extracellular metalloproteinase 5 [Coelomomyces lativittatus]
MSPLSVFLKFTDFLNLQVRPSDVHIQQDFTSSMAKSTLGYVATISKISSITQEVIPVSLSYVHDQGKLTLVYGYEMDLDEQWYHAHLDAMSGEVVMIQDWVSDAAYKVYPMGVNDPEDGSRVVVHPFISSASPAGWTMGSTTRGNNVEAQENLKGDTLNKPYEQKYRPEGGFKLNFKFPIYLKASPKAYLDAAITQLFYMNNMMHDLFYAYGFTEETGNFQRSNFGRPGLEGDPVIAHAQDGSGYNNANFATPPDGRSGRMRMYIWNTAEPNRDGDLENGIVIHEYSHGISTRLVGGPLNSGCLAWGEAGGMGEGWGDVFATILRMKANKWSRQFSWEMGKYANGGLEGIRKYPYTTNMEINPSTYEVLNEPSYWGVHAKGEVWAMILLEVYWNLVEKLGFTENWMTASSHYGNTLFLQLLIDGMKLQPCRPTFLQARDAILQAETLLTHGKHYCSLWKGFAKRGLGVSAKKIPSNHSPLDDEKRVNGFDVPEECSSVH